MADEELVIKLKIDNADAMAKQKAVGEGFDKVTTKANASAKKVGDAQAKTAQGQFVSIGRVQMAAVKLSDRIEADAKKISDKQIALAKRVADKQIAEAKRAADAAAKAFAEKEGGILNVLGKIGNAGLGFNFIAHAIGSISQAMTDGNKVIDSYAVNLLKVKDDLKELATLRGLQSASDDFIKEIASFSRSTGLSITQTDEFQRQFLGSSAGGAQKGSHNHRNRNVR
jgi:chromosomal replication initiation ATPase DnaA